MAGARQARDRHPQDGPRGAGRAVQHPRPGPLLHRAHGGRLHDYQAAHDAYHAAIGDRSARPCPAASASSGSTAPSCRRSRSATPTWSWSWARMAWSSTRPSTCRPARGRAQPRPGADRRRPAALSTFDDAHRAITLALGDTAKVWRDVTMAQAELNDGQRLLAVNDLFIGAEPTSRPAIASATTAARRTSPPAA